MQLQHARTCKIEEVPKHMMSTACVLVSHPAQRPSIDAKQSVLVFCFLSRIFPGAYTYEKLILKGGPG